MHITATDAKNRFGRICAEAKRGPVFVEKAGRLDTVILSAEHYQALQIGHNAVARKQAFEAEFASWIAAQNTWVEMHGIPGEDLRPW
jgi:prevent-host-death family protein